MATLLLEAVCISLCSIALGFIALEIRTKFDRSLLYFGITIFLLCLFCAVDLWKQPMGNDPYWVRVQHVIFCFIPPFMVWYIGELAHRVSMRVVKMFFVAGIVFSGLFMTNIMFIARESVVVSGTLYNVLFIPYTLLAVCYINYLLFRNWRAARDFDRKVFLFHLLGFVFLSVSGIYDMIVLATGRFFLPVPSMTIVGVLGLGILFTYIFTARLIRLINDRQTFLAELQTAYRDLDNARSLSELGQSTAIINHEIRNYSSAISGYAAQLKRRGNLDEKSGKMVDRIVDASVRVTEYSMEILDYSKSKMLKEATSIKLGSLIKGCIRNRFGREEKAFKLEGFKEDCVIQGSWPKLEQAFVNLFRNSFEAGATEIQVKLTLDKFVALVTIEDNGTGCPEEELDQLFAAFYTTKDKSGLGLPVSRSIIEGHGGRVTAISRSSFDAKQTGLVLFVTFPIHTEYRIFDRNKKDKVVLVRDRLQDLSHVVGTFHNVCVNPHLVNTINEIEPDMFPPEDNIVVGGKEAVAQLNAKHPGYRSISLVKSRRYGTHAVGTSSEDIAGLFTEEFVLNAVARRTAF